MLAPSANARATPKLACARASPINARPFNTTKLPRIPQTAATSTEASRPRCIKPNWSGSSRCSSIVVRVLYGYRAIAQLQDHKMALVGLIQELRGENLLRTPEGDYPLVQEQRQVKALGNAREVVGGHDHGLPRLL